MPVPLQIALLVFVLAWGLALVRAKLWTRFQGLTGGHRSRLLKALQGAPEGPRRDRALADVIDQLKDGVMICTGGDSPAADKGRAYTKRTDPT